MDTNFRRDMLLRVHIFGIIVGLILAGTGCAPAATTTACNLDTPEFCIGQVIRVTDQSGRTNTILVEAVTEDGIELRANNRFDYANTDLELIIGLDIDNNQPYIINRLFVTNLQVGDSALPGGWIDALLLGAAGVLVFIILRVLIVRRVPAPSREELSPLDLDQARQWITKQPLTALAQRQIAIETLRNLELEIEEVDFLAVGGGLGSFAWVDHLRVAGVQPRQIAVITAQPQPYTTFQRYAHHSQLFDSDRIRSDSGATPDNVWGWPGYAVREIGRSLLRGQIGTALRILWQIFTEPVLVEPYTPRAGDVFQSIDREANRINWGAMCRPGFAHTIRRTDDNRYAVAYATQSGEWQHKMILTRALHLAPGYAAPRITHSEFASANTPEQESARVVHAYQNHTHIYDHLALNGGRVLLRGRGVAASQIIQRLADLRTHNDTICVMHVLRSPLPEDERGSQPARRRITSHRRLQPFNWPKSAFGGTWRSRWAQAGEAERAYLFKALGGTTTPARQLWQDTLDAGLREGWYQMYFGEIATIETDTNPIAVYLRDMYGRDSLILATDFLIDATGLDARVDLHPLLHDLCQRYDLKLNPFGGLDVSADFEVKNMPNLFAAGVITTGNDYAPVDSFLGLQFAALRAVDTLADRRAPGLRRLNGLISLVAWLRWAAGLQP